MQWPSKSEGGFLPLLGHFGLDLLYMYTIFILILISSTKKCKIIFKRTFSQHFNSIELRLMIARPFLLERC